MEGDIPMITNRRTKGKSKDLDAWLGISGMTAGEVVTPEWLYHPLFVIPEWFYEGSTVLKVSGFPPPRHPGNF